jgi:hypothetical protein
MAGYDGGFLLGMGERLDPPARVRHDAVVGPKGEPASRRICRSARWTLEPRDAATAGRSPAPRGQSARYNRLNPVRDRTFAVDFSGIG